MLTSEVSSISFNVHESCFFNVHVSCFVDFVLCPTDKYMFKVNIKKKINLLLCSKIKTNTPKIVLMFLLLTLTTISTSSQHFYLGAKDKS